MITWGQRCVGIGIGRNVFTWRGYHGPVNTFPNR